MCLSRLHSPALRVSTVRVSGLSRKPPPWVISALMEATTTTQSGLMPDCLQTMSMNFSPPRSDANPASVMT